MARGGSPRGCGLLWAPGQGVSSPPTLSLPSLPCPPTPPLHCRSSRALHLGSWLVKSPLVREEGVFWRGLAWCSSSWGRLCRGAGKAPGGQQGGLRLGCQRPQAGPGCCMQPQEGCRGHWQRGARRLLQASLSTPLSRSAQSGYSSRSMRLQPRNLQAVGAGGDGGQV